MRSRGKLVIIADKQWLQRTQTYSHGLLWTIVFGFREGERGRGSQARAGQPRNPARTIGCEYLKTYRPGNSGR
jgi:hypothetical protein